MSDILWLGRPCDEPPPFQCESCGEICDPDDCSTTWQQWECPCCGSWNDREGRDE